MPTAIRIEPDLRDTIIGAIHADSNLCYNCGTCINACPIYLSTSRLDPRKLVFMANLGLIEELVQLFEIWYCIQCNRCSNLCPMTVKPPYLIRYLRQEAVYRGVVSKETVACYQELRSHFPRVLWHAVSMCQNGQSAADILPKWDELLKEPVMPLAGTVTLDNLLANSGEFKKSAQQYVSSSTNFASCFTCTECSSTCPVCYERNVFDPVWIFRMTNLGLKEDILRLPTIWVCIDCGSCSDACSQGVKGQLVIRRLQEMSVEEGFVDNDFPKLWQELRNALYGRFLEEIDKMFRFS